MVVALGTYLANATHVDVVVHHHHPAAPSVVDTNPAFTDKALSGKPLKVLAGISMMGEFVGRKGDLERLDHLLKGPNRYITIHGFGGIGKTSLALQVALRFDAGKVLALPLV